MMIADLRGRGGKRGPRIGVIGSCRVHEPLRMYVNAGAGRFVWYNDNAFTHTPPEASQYFRVCLGEKPLPNYELAPLVFSSPGRTFLDTKLHAAAKTCDIYLIEVSSTRFIRFRELYIQLDYLQNHFLRGTGLGPLKWWRRVLDGGDRTDLVAPALADMSTAGRTVTPTTEALLNEIETGELSDDDMRTELQQFASASNRRYVLVPHFDLVSLTPNERELRGGLNGRLARVVEGTPWEIFDYSQVLADHEKSFALAGGGTDHYHLNGNFLPQLWPAYEALLSA